MPNLDELWNDPGASPSPFTPAPLPPAPSFGESFRSELGNTFKPLGDAFNTVTGGARDLMNAGVMGTAQELGLFPEGYSALDSDPQTGELTFKRAADEAVNAAYPEDPNAPGLNIPIMKEIQDYRGSGLPGADLLGAGVRSGSRMAATMALDPATTLLTGGSGAVQKAAGLAFGAAGARDLGPQVEHSASEFLQHGATPKAIEGGLDALGSAAMVGMGLHGGLAPEHIPGTYEGSVANDLRGIKNLWDTKVDDAQAARDTANETRLRSQAAQEEAQFLPQPVDGVGLAPSAVDPQVDARMAAQEPAPPWASDQRIQGVWEGPQQPAPPVFEPAPLPVTPEAPQATIPLSTTPGPVVDPVFQGDTQAALGGLGLQAPPETTPPSLPGVWSGDTPEGFRPAEMPPTPQSAPDTLFQGRTPPEVPFNPEPLPKGLPPVWDRQGSRKARWDVPGERTVEPAPAGPGISPDVPEVWQGDNPINPPEPQGPNPPPSLPLDHDLTNAASLTGDAALMQTLRDRVARAKSGGELTTADEMAATSGEPSRGEALRSLGGRIPDLPETANPNKPPSYIPRSDVRGFGQDPSEIAARFPNQEGAVGIGRSTRLPTTLKPRVGEPTPSRPSAALPLASAPTPVGAPGPRPLAIYRTVKHVVDIFDAINNFTRRTKAGLDQSTSMRQGAFFTTNPRTAHIANQATLRSLRGLVEKYPQRYTTTLENGKVVKVPEWRPGDSFWNGDPHAMAKWDAAEVQTRPRYQQYKDSGLALTHLGGDDIYAQRLSAAVERVVDAADRHTGDFYRKSENSALGTMNQMRMDVFDYLANQIEQKSGHPMTPEVMKDLGNYVNVGTGFGTLPQFVATINPILNRLGFSPRLVASRLQLAAAPLYGMTLQPEVRAMLIKDMGANMGTLALTLGLASAMGASVVAPDPQDIYRDPKKLLDSKIWENPDFLKIRMGNLRVDLLGGVQQSMRFYYKMVRQSYRELRGEHKSNNYGDPSALEVAGRFGRSKLAPLAGLAATAYNRRNFIGQKFDPKSGDDWAREISDLMLPMTPSDIYDMEKELASQGSLAKVMMVGLPLAAYSFLGGSVTTYEKKRVQ